MDALLPKARQEILAAALLRPDKWWYLSDLAKHLGRTPSTLQRELASLTRAGILRKRQDGNRVYFQANPACPILHELQAILTKTIGMLDVLRDALAPFAKRIESAFVYGSLARAEELSESDIDLMIIGNIRLSEIAAPLREAEHGLFRPVNPTVYAAAEYARKLREGHNFITTVHNGKKLFVIGTYDELESIAAGEPGAATQRQ